MDSFEEKMEERWIEQQIEDEAQELAELESDLALTLPSKRTAYDMASSTMSTPKEQIAWLKTVLSAYHYGKEAR